MALALCVGALPFVFFARAHAQETTGIPGLWDEYKRPVGLTYGAQARIQTTYLWRGIYAGGANIQGSANVGYGGLYADMWWNIGVTCGFFDFGNYPDKGNRLELDIRWTVSEKLPLSFLWATRVAAADGYMNATGDTVRAYSSYAEISYTQALPFGLSLYGAVGITPWRSCYTFYQRDFAVQNIEVRLRKDWSVSERCGLMLQGQLSINPSALAADHTTSQWKPEFPFEQSVNANIAFGVYLK